MSRIRKRRRRRLRRVVPIPYWMANDPLARGIELFLMIFCLFFHLTKELDLVFHYTLLVNIKVAFLPKEVTKSLLSAVSRFNHP